jgi:acetolactate synthase-1/2/3 large subunit
MDEQMTTGKPEATQSADQKWRIMNGAESLVDTLIANEVTTCFTNPETVERYLAAAHEKDPGIRSVICLFEGVAAGAADGFARIARKPAATLLHGGPGLANGLANLHGACRAHIPIINIVGDQGSYFRGFDIPPNTDIESWAQPVSVWTKTSRNVAAIGADAATAVHAARSRSGVATLILPPDACWNIGGIPAPRFPVASRQSVSNDAIEGAASVLRSGKITAIILGGTALEAGASIDAHRIAAKTGAQLFSPVFSPLIERGRGRRAIPVLPHSAEDAIAVLSGFEQVILVGAADPVAFPAYPHCPRSIRPGKSHVFTLASEAEDAGPALAALADALSAPLVSVPANTVPERPSGSITGAGMAQVLAAAIPENAIVVDESRSFGLPFYAGTSDAAPHDWLQLAGGVLGQGMPVATGAAIAAPDRRVISLEGDGSTFATIQALWTQARERLNITTIIMSRPGYTLGRELDNADTNANTGISDLFDLGSPDIDWINLANAFGIEAVRAFTLDQLSERMTDSFARKGPFLIELVIE